MLDELALQILDSMEQGILVFDIKGNLLYWNEFIATNFINNKNDSKTLHDLFPQFWKEYNGIIVGTSLVQDVIIKGLHKEILRFPITTKDNQVRYFDLKSFPLKNKDNSIQCAVLCFLDATENIKQESQFLNQIRTTSFADLREEIAEEIRNPLNSIELNAELLQKWMSCPQKNERQEILDTVADILDSIKRKQRRESLGYIVFFVIIILLVLQLVAMLFGGM